MFDHVHIPARRLLPGLVAAMALLAMAGTASAATPPGHYTISANGGAVFPLQTSGNLVSGASDDHVYYLSTTGTGLQKLPFTINYYNHGYKKIGISTNGNIQFGVDPVNVPGTTEYANDCLASPAFAKTVAMPFWDDLYFDSTDTSSGFVEGVFVKTKGSPPHRTFAVNWQGHRYNESGVKVLARAVFTEGSQTLTYTYGVPGGGSATIGTQFAGGTTDTQWSCNSGSGTTVTNGMKLTFLHAN
jgi:hypothetical protein